MQATAISQQKGGHGLATRVECKVNSWEADQAKVFSNAELSDLTCAIGTGLFTPTMTDEEVGTAMAKLRYDKIIIMADADIDGCFTKDTVVATTGGLMTFGALIEDAERGIIHTGYAIDVETGMRIEVALENPHVTKSVHELARVVFTNGKSAWCTPDHQFRLRNGSYVRADRLEPSMEIEAGDDVMHIVMVHHEELIEPKDVCDLSVTKHHNFQLASGAFVHNSHIECLLLGHLYKHSLPLIERGHVYIALPPLYRVTEKGKHTFLKDDTAMAAFFRRRAKGAVGDDPSLTALAGVSTQVRATIEGLAGQIGTSPVDLSHALRAVASYEDTREDWLRAFAERIVEIRGEECEGVEAHEAGETGEAVVVSGLESGGRYFTTVIDQQFYEAVVNVWNALSEDSCLGQEVLADIATGGVRAVDGESCRDIYSMAAAIDRSSRRGVSIQRNKGLGEMQAEELGETTLDRSTRRLIRVNVADFDAAGEFVGSMLSSSTVEARREVVRSTRVNREMVDA